MGLVSWLFWGSALIVICFIFWRLWKYASKIEQLELEEEQWKNYLNWLWQTDPYQAQYYQQQFEEKYYQ